MGHAGVSNESECKVSRNGEYILDAHSNPNRRDADDRFQEQSGHKGVSGLSLRLIEKIAVEIVAGAAQGSRNEERVCREDNRRLLPWILKYQLANRLPGMD